MPVCYLLGNLDNKAYRRILGIMMSKDGRICFILVPDKNIIAAEFFKFQLLLKL